MAKVASGETLRAHDGGTVPRLGQVGLLCGLVGERKPEIKKRPKPGFIFLKLIILMRKKDIYNGGEIGYDEAEK